MKNFITLPKFNSISSLVAVGVALSTLVGCGTDAPPVAAQAPVATTAQVTPAAPNFEQNCKDTAGTLLTSEGVQVCKRTIFVVNPGSPSFLTFDQSQYTPFYRLTTDDPSGSYAFPTGYTVKPGDLVSFSASGGWGSKKASFFNVYFGICTPFGCSGSGYEDACTSIKLDGTAGGKVKTTNSLAAGIVGTDGTEVFLLGNSTKKVIKNEGALKWGFNVAVAEQMCAKLTISNFSITRCEDATGKTHPCDMSVSL